jgi:hypothetical protein
VIAGVLLVLVGLAGAGWSVDAASSRGRPVDIGAALLAPVFILCAIVGAVACFVPRFL